MSESAWQSRAELPPLFRPEMMIGAASPLWGYFTGVAAAGVAFWWATRWVRPEDFEAASKAMTAPALAFAAEAASEVEAVVEATFEPVVEAVAEAVGGPVAEALVGEETPMIPVGGESAPFGAATLEAELQIDPALEAELAPKAETPPSEPAAAPTPRSRKPRGESEAKPH